MNMVERWKAIEGYEGIYEVSDHGKVRSTEGKITHSVKHGKRVWQSKELKLKTDKYGYKRVSLYKDKKAKDFLVHRLVATAFCERKKGKDLINHIDGKPDNNYYENLEWCDYYDNLMHAYQNGMNKAPKAIKLVNKIDGKENVFYSMAEASRFLGKAHGYVSNLLKTGKTECTTHYIMIV
jgi:hypothetical protein